MAALGRRDCLLDACRPHQRCERLSLRPDQNDELGRRLIISPLTAKTHVSRILGKLHARDRAQLVVIAYETGLVPRQT